MDGATLIACVDLFDLDGRLVAAAGSSCERVDPLSLPWLRAQGLVVTATPTDEAGESEAT